MAANSSDIITSTQLGVNILEKLFNQLKLLGGTDEDLLRLTEPYGDLIIKRMALCVVSLAELEARRWREVPIEELDLEVRPYNLLKKVGIHSVWELMNLTQDELRAIPSFGARSLVQVREALAVHYHLQLRDS